MEEAYISLVRCCAEKLVAKELELSPDTILDIVKDTLKPLAHQSQVVIKVNPKDEDILRTHISKLIHVMLNSKNIHIQSESALDRGDVLITSNLGHIDARMSKKLDVLEKVLKQELKQHVL